MTTESKVVLDAELPLGSMRPNSRRSFVAALVPLAIATVLVLVLAFARWLHAAPIA